LGGSLTQKVFLRVNYGGKTMYTLTNLDGTYGFSLPPDVVFPVQVEFACMGSYERSFIIVSQPQGNHDVSLIQVASSKTVASSSVRIDITVANTGGFTETFVIEARANGTTVQTQTITLASQTSVTATLIWNTGGYARGVYKISAYAQPVPLEANTADNSLDDGYVKLVLIQGDINADNSVDIYDVLILASAFNSTPNNANFNPNADLNSDGIVDMYDALLLAANYGKTA
jgi:hypothetical protein